MEFIKSNWKPLVAELVGTSLLVFAGSAVMIVSPEFQIEMKRSISGAFLADPGLRFGMTLAALAVAIGQVSGAHYNPIVSLAALICGRIEWLPCIFYVLAQLGGSIVGALLAFVVCGGTGVTIPGPYEHRLIIALCVEILITMLLVLVFLGVSDPDRGDAVKDLGGIAVGLALAVGHWVGVPLSGASMNPWRSLASAIVEGEFKDFWLYLIAPPVGSLLSALLYRFVFSGAKQEG